MEISVSGGSGAPGSNLDAQGWQCKLVQAMGANGNCCPMIEKLKGNPKGVSIFAWWVHGAGTLGLQCGTIAVVKLQVLFIARKAKNAVQQLACCQGAQLRNVWARHCW